MIERIRPFETQESMLFAQRLQKTGLLSTHIPNETRTPYKGELAKLKKMGVTRGLPDFLIVIDEKKSICGRTLLLWVEMKRVPKISSVSIRKVTNYTSDVRPDQRIWLKQLSQVSDVEAVVAYGHQAAIKFVCKYLDDPYGSFSFNDDGDVIF